MNWFFIALFAPLLWAITNHIDKYLVTKQLSRIGVGSLIVFAAVIDLLLLPIIPILEPESLHVSPQSLWLILLSGFFFVYYLFPYYKALEKDEASIVVPLFQMVPVLSYFVGLIFLQETINTRQILGGIIIIAASVGLTMDLRGSFKINVRTLFLMFCSSTLIVFGALIFKVVAEKESYWGAIFWQGVGMIIASFLLLLFKKYRDDVLNMFKNSGKTLYGIMTLNEIINVGAGMIINYSYLLVPLVLAQLVGSFQPLFVFLFGILLTIFWPKFNTENIARKYLVQKITFIIIMIAGSYLLFT